MLIRQLENLGKLMRLALPPDLRHAVHRHARLILATGEETVRRDLDRAAIRAAFALAMPPDRTSPTPDQLSPSR